MKLSASVDLGLCTKKEGKNVSMSQFQMVVGVVIQGHGGVITLKNNLYFSNAIISGSKR